MSYATSFALQSAVYNALAGDQTLQGLVNGAIYDAIPSGTRPDLYISLGTETAKDASDVTGRGAWHRFAILVTSTAPGFSSAKGVAAAICDVLVDADLPLTRGRLVALNFDTARASRTDANNGRQIELRFRARLEDS